MKLDQICLVEFVSMKVILAIKMTLFQIKRKARSHVRRDRTEGTNTTTVELTNLPPRATGRKKRGIFTEPPKGGADPESDQHDLEVGRSPMVIHP